MALLIHEIIPINHIDPRECRLYKLEVPGGSTQHHGDMVEVIVSDQALELACELRCLEEEYIACVRYLLEVVLVDTRTDDRVGVPCLHCSLYHHRSFN
jgi:hypothetical protein